MSMRMQFKQIKWNLIPKRVFSLPSYYGLAYVINLQNPKSRTVLGQSMIGMQLASSMASIIISALQHQHAFSIPATTHSYPIHMFETSPIDWGDMLMTVTGRTTSRPSNSKETQDCKKRDQCGDVDPCHHLGPTLSTKLIDGKVNT